MPSPSIISSPFTPELVAKPYHELVYLTARGRIDEATRSHIAHLITRGVAWDLAVDFAIMHGVAGLLYDVLHRGNYAGIPADVLQRLKLHYLAHMRNGMLYERELGEIVQLCLDKGVEVIPFKGLILAREVYGDLGLRPFADLDLLVRFNDFTKVKDVLHGRDYRPYQALKPEHEAAFLKSQLGYEMISGDGHLMVELHWSFLNRIHAFRFDPEGVIQRARRIELDGVSIRSFAPSDLLLYLGAHNCRHFWDRFLLVCDIAELLRRYEDEFDWAKIIDDARGLRAERMLFVALTLASGYGDAPIPEWVQVKAQSDRRALDLARRVARWQLRTPGKQQKGFSAALFHLQMRERERDRWPYYGHLFKLLFNR